MNEDKDTNTKCSEVAEENEVMSREELNYKNGYAVLFNGMNEIVKLTTKTAIKMMNLQRLSEETCIAEPNREIKVNTDEFIKQISEMVRQNIEEELENN
jgi:predicted transcriptional regulator